MTLVKASGRSMLSGFSDNAILSDKAAYSPMTDNEQEIQHAAEHMIERYADRALSEVDLRIQELQSRNQVEALRLWCAIRERVEFLVGLPKGERRH